MRSQFVVTLDGRPLPSPTPLIRADDPVFSRGDGVFETLLVRRRRPVLLEAHLSRLDDSAALVGLPPPDGTAMRASALAAAGRCGDDDAVLRLVHGRGRDGGACLLYTSPACRWATPSWRRCSSSAVSSCTPPAW